jgi:hypothetical protein
MKSLKLKRIISNLRPEAHKDLEQQLINKKTA